MELIKMIVNAIRITVAALYGLGRDFVVACWKGVKKLKGFYTRRRTPQFMIVQPNEALFVVATLKVRLGHRRLYRQGDTWFLGLPAHQWDRLLRKMQRLTFASEPMTDFDNRVRAVLEKKKSDSPAPPSLAIAAG